MGRGQRCRGFEMSEATCGGGRSCTEKVDKCIYVDAQYSCDGVI